MLRLRSLVTEVRRVESRGVLAESAVRQRSPLPLDCEFNPVEGDRGDRLDTAQWNAVGIRDNFCLHLRTGGFGERTNGNRDCTIRCPG
jgi:hypothetical protein